MFCSKCGNVIPENASFCPECGAKIYNEPKAEVTPTVLNGSTNTLTYDAGSVLKTGIIASAFCCTFFLSFVGIIIGIIGIKRAKLFKKENGRMTPKAIVGLALSISGVALGAFLTVYLFIWLIVMLAVLTNAAVDYSVFY